MTFLFDSIDAFKLSGHPDSAAKNGENQAADSMIALSPQAGKPSCIFKYFLEVVPERVLGICLVSRIHV